ncbi:hypothetical protein DM02DRAFT_400044 [Periconia macrospinosa]|uniref:Uncharacterized protein n=1 Tax=Periconia macrospinosa TaxID=97972 RepID=A0A2V1DPZ1_9PLEO|nr:hypothetical protein DM02DRAFT_400044 [Periconia macrospinosa]
MSVIETTPTDSPLRREDKKARRRFSSPFHRSSRSRSRPSSIILPSSFLFDFSNSNTPKDTPPRETPSVLSESLLSNFTYQAPDEWDVVPEEKTTPAASAGGPRLDGNNKLIAPTPERLGVLPSPAKSAYSFLPHDREDDNVPPIPRIPSQRLIESVVRYSTPELEKWQADTQSLIHPAFREREGYGYGYGNDNGNNGEVGEEQEAIPAERHDSLANAIGRVSPAVSSVGADRLSLDEGVSEGEPLVHVHDGQPDGFLQLRERRHLSMGDVSPMFPPANLELGGSDEASQLRLTPAAFRAAYETELIGGDVSPISRQAASDAEDSEAEGQLQVQLQGSAMDKTKPPTQMTWPGVVVEPAPSLSASPLPSHAHAVAPGQGLDMDDAEALTPRAAEDSEQRPRFTERLSATRLQVVHAQQYFAPSHSQSSFETLDQDTDGSAFGDNPLDDDLHPVPPLQPLALNPKGHRGQPPSVAPPQQPKQQTSPPVVISITKSPALTNPAASVKTNPAPQQLPPTETPPNANKQPESMLSRLSSMVSSDSASVSPLSSQGHPSSPPSVNRQHAVSPAKLSRTPAQIVEEQTPQLNGTAASHYDFDLYADQDGVVKGVRDESGQPLRIASPDISTNMQHQPQAGRSNTPGTQPVTPKPTEEDSPRYSEERPMSFVSGPRDSNGRPQDQINRPNSASSERGEALLRRTPQSTSSNGVAYAASPLGQQVQRTTEQPNQYPVRSQNHDDVPTSNDPRLDGQLSPPGPTIPHTSNSSVSPDRLGPPLNHGQYQLRQGQDVSNGHAPNVQDSRLMRDPRLIVEAQMRAARLGQNFPPDARLQGQNVQPNAAIPSHLSGATQYSQQGFDQQMMVQHLTDPRFHQGQQQNFGSPYAQPTSNPPKKEEKPSSRPKLPSVFKSLGKAHATTPSPPPQQALQPPQPDDRRRSASGASSHGSGRGSASQQSYVGELPEHIGAKKERKSGTFSLFPSRPESLGTASHFSHDSTHAQPAESRFNLTSPDLPPNFAQVGIPPQRPPTGSFPESRPSQDPRFSVVSSPEPVKKKRFSALGNLFSRNKEDKKALKAKKHNTLPPMQPGQPWPPQQPQQQLVRPQHQNLRYEQPPSGRPFPGMQIAPAPIVSPISPQGVPSQTIHQQAMQPLPPGMQQQLHQPYQQQISQGYPQQQLSQPTHTQVQQQQLPLQEGSAYNETQRRAEQHQSNMTMSQRPPENIGVTGIPLNHQHQSVNWSGGTAQPPLGEYYISETQLPDHRQGISQQQIFHPSQQQQQQQQQRAPATQPSNIQNPHTHQSAACDPNNTFPDTQRHNNPTADEPRYDTPAIPAAYAQVSGAYVSPNVEEPPPPPNAQSRDRHASLGYYNRQPSEPQLHPLSPQISAITQAPTNRHNSDTSSVSLISPISNSPPNIANPIPMQSQKPQNPRMSSITEQSHAERTWNLNLPEGATEQEIVRAHQKQYIEQQLLAQEQLYAERTGRSPSPRSHTTQSPSPRPGQQQFPHPLSQNGGFRELMPRSSPQPYPRTQQTLHPRASSDMLDPEKEMLARNAAQNASTPGRTPTPTSYPHSPSPDSVHVPSPRNHVPSPQPSPVPSNANATHGSISRTLSSQQVQSPQSLYHVHQQSPRYEEHVAPDEQYWPPAPHETQHQESNYEHSPPADQPPPYSGPALPTDGMEKDRQDRHRPPNIVTNTNGPQGRYMERQRQISVGMLQHPQPASMAASPSPSSADMGAESLRRQLLHQEETERQELLRRAQTQREESIRERQERTRARERARALERSVSGGGRVPSLKNDIGSTRATGSGWERRSGSTSRPVFELSAEDDEPVMRATSFPGQEWVPTWNEE